MFKCRFGRLEVYYTFIPYMDCVTNNTAMSETLLISSQLEGQIVEVKDHPGDVTIVAAQYKNVEVGFDPPCGCNL